MAKDITPREYAYNLILRHLQIAYDDIRVNNPDDLNKLERKAVLKVLAREHNNLLDVSGLDGVALDIKEIDGA